MTERKPLQEIVLGTAGHVDHGKTTLIRALTGMETDRLEEESRRGISIELGFAWLDDERIGRLAFIDVPGHERFVRRMIAGSAGMDGVLLVVAADEGIMPQTREHLDICELLGVRGGLVVITKTDMVDEDWLDLVREELMEDLQGTFLEGAPVVGCSALDSGSIDRVRERLVTIASELQDDHVAEQDDASDRPFKMSVDRVFTMRGFGTVVTGTSQAGRVAVGQELEVKPGAERVKVRGLQVHGEPQEEAGPGLRLALNLQGSDKEAIERGSVLADPAGVFQGSMFDGWMRLRPHLLESPRSGARAMLHVGTHQVEVTLTWVRPPELPGGTAAQRTGLMQLRADHPIAVTPGERFVLRGSGSEPSHGRTVGGGALMSPADRRHRSSDLGRAAALDEIASGDPKRMIAAVVKRGGQEGRPSNLAGRLDLSATTMKRTLDDLLSEGRLVEAGERLLHVDAAGQLGQQIRSELQTYHGRHPARAGMAAEELRTRVRASLDGTLFQDLLSWMAGEGEVNFERGTVALTSFTPRRTDAQRAACDALGTALNQGGTTPPRIKDLPDTLGLEDDATDDALHLLLADGTAVRISQELVYDREILERLQGELVEHLQRHGSIDAGGFKELTGASRKWSIPLLEYFDRIKLTVRRGDQRTLRRAL